MKEVFIIAITYNNGFGDEMTRFYQSKFIPNITDSRRKADRFENYPSIQAKIEELIKGDKEERFYNIEKFFVKA